MKLHQIAIIGCSLGMAIATIPLALSMLPQELHLAYITFKIWMFGVVPCVFLYPTGKEKK